MTKVSNIDEMELEWIKKYRLDLVKLRALWIATKEEIDKWDQLDDRTKFFIHMTVRMILVDSHSFLKHYREFLSKLFHQSAYFKQYSWKKVDLPKTQWLRLPGDPEIPPRFRRKHHEEKQKGYIESRKKWIADFFGITPQEVPDQKVPNSLLEDKVKELQDYIDSIKGLRNQHAHIYDFRGEAEDCDLIEAIETTLQYCKDQISKLYMIRGSCTDWDLNLF